MSQPSSFKPNCFASKVVVITGGGSGIGKGITRKFMELGANTAILSRNEEKLTSAAHQLESETNQECFVISVDVRNYEAVSEAIDKILSHYGRIDILVNCAAGNFLCPLEKLTYNGFKTVMEIDCYGTFITSHTVFKKAFKYHGGCIINISMTLHYTAALLQTHAGAAKAAIDAMSRHMAVEWGPYNVRVNVVAPGPIGDTEGMSRLNPNTQSQTGGKAGKSAENASATEMLEMAVPLQRLGHTEDISNAVAFLCLPEASYITAATLVVDGGQWLTSGNFTVLNPSTMATWAQKGKEAAKQGAMLRKNNINPSKL